MCGRGHSRAYESPPIEVHSNRTDVTSIRQPKVSGCRQFASRPILQGVFEWWEVLSVFPMTWQLQSLEALAGDSEVDGPKLSSRGLKSASFCPMPRRTSLNLCWSSPFGRVYKLFLDRCCIHKFSGPEAENRRNDLSQQLRQVGCESPEGWAVLSLALFPFFPP